MQIVVTGLIGGAYSTAVAMFPLKAKSWVAWSRQPKSLPADLGQIPITPADARA